MSTKSEIRARNMQFWEELGSNDPGMQKEAATRSNEFVRTKLRESSFQRDIQPIEPVTAADLDIQHDTEASVIIGFLEPESPAAMTLPYQDTPPTLYVHGGRYRIMFNRQVTQRFTKDVAQLRTYTYDFRQVLSDNAVKDLGTEEDWRFIRACNALLGARDSVIASTGAVQYVGLPGGVTRDNFITGLQIGVSTPSKIPTSTILVNAATSLEFAKWGYDEAGGDLSQSFLQQGFAEQELLKKRIVITIKHELVPDNTMYLFADPKFIGQYYLLEDTTLYIKRENYKLEFFAYQETGGAIASIAGVCRVDFLP